jgi:glucose/arabinose dehydrogenase
MRRFAAVAALGIVAAACSGAAITPSTTGPSPTTATTAAATTTTPEATSTTEAETTTTPPAPTTTTRPPTPLADVEIDLELITGGFRAPLEVLSRGSGDGAAGDDRLFVVDQSGTITALVLGPPGEEPTERSVVLDISAKLRFGGERGLLGAVFHPDSPERLFVDYTRAPDGATVVEEYSFPVGADAAEATPVRTILVQPQPAVNHNGGMLAFGPDRYLYIGLGDGGGAGDTYRNGQNPHTLLGTILRIDVDGATPYSIPPDNPFADGVDGEPEIWLWGLRNPWRFSFDGEDLWIGDVGQERYEEIDLVGPSDGGANLGWSTVEGTHCYRNPCDDPTAFTLPLYVYPHDQGRCSITGGYVYRGRGFPDLDGAYLFADYCTGEIWALRHDGAEVTEVRGYAFGVGELSSFGLDRSGELYVTAGDSVYRVVPAA